jgi:hypothetical protein
MPRWVIFLVLGLIPTIAVIAVGGVQANAAGDSLGRLDMPGKKRFTLDPGEVTLSFEERRNYPDDETMPPPDTFGVRVLDPGGDRVKLRGASGSVSEGDGWARRAMRSFDVEERGTYTVVAGRPDGGRPDPAVTLGEDAWDVFKPWLLRGLAAGAAGLALAAVVVALLALRARSRERRPAGLGR